jgi:hypothetical protein
MQLGRALNGPNFSNSVSGRNVCVRAKVKVNALYWHCSAHRSLSEYFQQTLNFLTRHFFPAAAGSIAASSSFHTVNSFNFNAPLFCYSKVRF